jgi:hypothetical protein
MFFCKRPERATNGQAVVAKRVTMTFKLAWLSRLPKPAA